jgi:hypothetical protein
MEKSKAKSKLAHSSIYKEVNILYQKLGGKWFAFSLIGDEVFFGAVPESTIEHLKKKTRSPLDKSQKLPQNHLSSKDFRTKQKNHTRLAKTS